MLKSEGRAGETVILRKHSQPTEVITQSSISTIADFEYISPRTAPDLFLPMRLYQPYGYWIEGDGSRVLFSRDYQPMWRLKDGCENERLKPWAKINSIERKYLWSYDQTPWSSKKIKTDLESCLLKNRVWGLPKLADALPLLIHDSSNHGLNIAMAAQLLNLQSMTQQR